MKRTRLTRGATLIELVVTIALIGIIAVVAFQPWTDSTRALLAEKARAQAISICQSMMEHYKAVGYSQMAASAPTTKVQDWQPDITVDGTVYRREMEFIDIAPSDPNIVLIGARDATDGWFCTDTYTAPGGAVIVHRFRSFKCTVSWTDNAGNIHSESLVGVVAP